MKKQKPIWMSPECWAAERKAAALDRAEAAIPKPGPKQPKTQPTISNAPLTFQPPVKSRAEIAAILAREKKEAEIAKQRAQQQAEAKRQRTEFTIYRSRTTGLFWRKLAEVEGYTDQMERVSTSDVSVQPDGNTALWNGKTVQIVNL